MEVAWPRSRSVINLVQQFGNLVAPYMRLDAGWKTRVMEALEQVEPVTTEADKAEAQKIRNALDNLQKQHLWGDVLDEEYRVERAALERRLKMIDKPPKPREIPNLERAAQMLEDLRGLWDHPGVADEQREALLGEVFQHITIDGKALTSIEPKLAYRPLFGCILTSKEFGYREIE